MNAHRDQPMAARLNKSTVPRLKQASDRHSVAIANAVVTGIPGWRGFQLHINHVLVDYFVKRCHGAFYHLPGKLASFGAPAIPALALRSRKYIDIWATK